MSSDTDRHDSSHEEWIAELIAGERSLDDPSVANRLNSCAECRSDLEALRSLGAALDADAAFDARVLAQSEQTAVGPRDRAAFERVRQEHLSTGLENQRSPTLGTNRAASLWLMRVAAAAVLALAAIWFMSSRSDDRTPEAGQLSGDLALSPCGAVDSVTVFSIAGDLPRGWKYSFRVCPLDERGNMLEPVLRSPAWLPTPRWELDAAQILALPQHFRWFVDIEDSRQAPVKTASCDVELRSR